MYSFGCEHQSIICDLCKHESIKDIIKNRNFQIEENIKVNKKIRELEEKIDVALVAIQINISSHNERIHELEKGFSEKYTEPLCSAAFIHENKVRLSFIDAVKLCLKGKKLTRSAWNGTNWKGAYIFENYSSKTINCFIPDFPIFSFSNVKCEDIIANDWEVVE